jgi:hypothetical protein
MAPQFLPQADLTGWEVPCVSLVTHVVKFPTTGLRDNFRSQLLVRSLFGQPAIPMANRKRIGESRNLA